MNGGGGAAEGATSGRRTGVAGELAREDRQGDTARDAKRVGACDAGGLLAGSGAGEDAERIERGLAWVAEGAANRSERDGDATGKM